MSTLKEIIASPANPMASNFAEQVLRVVGEVLPKRLSQSVPLWTISDVEFWVTQVKEGLFLNFARKLEYFILVYITLLQGYFNRCCRTTVTTVAGLL